MHRRIRDRILLSLWLPDSSPACETDSLACWFRCVIDGDARGIEISVLKVAT